MINLYKLLLALLAVLELASFIAGGFFVVLWIRTTNSNYEAWSALAAGVVGEALDRLRKLVQGLVANEAVTVDPSIVERGRLRERIDAAESILQMRLNRDKQQLAIASEAFGQVRVIAHYNPTNPVFQELANNLQKLVAQLKEEIGPAPISDADSRRIRIAEGLIANALGLYDDALKSVTEMDVAAELAVAQTAIEQVVKANQIRADAYHGLRRWEGALAGYKRILALRPSDLQALINCGNCLSLLNRYPDALRAFDNAIDTLARLAEREVSMGAVSTLTACLSNRGYVFLALGKYAEAARDLDQALKVLAPLVEQKGCQDLADMLATILSNRGIALRRLSKHAESLQDQDRAVAIWDKLVKEQGRAEFVTGLAASLNNRGHTLNCLGKQADARRPSKN